MLRTALQVSGVARALGNLKLRLEEKAEDATAQMKGVAVRIAIAAGLAMAAVMFVAMALIAALLALYVYLYPLYGVIPALGIVGGLLLAIALASALAAIPVARRKSAKKAARTPVDFDEEESEPARYASPPREREARAASEVTESILSLAEATGRSQRRRVGGRADWLRFDHDTPTDAVTLLQSGDRRTMVAVLGAVTALGWLLGRTMPHAPWR